tara:strand:+ start:1867 stop:2145 length:279 start_codon:yes stop_codon:yes gene_type:complete
MKMQPHVNIDSLYDEMRVMRDHLLNRIELLESDIELLTKENMDYAKQMYELENYLEDRIDTMLDYLKTIRSNEGLEYKEGSKEINKKSKETS